MNESYFVRWWNANPERAEFIRARRRLKRIQDPERAEAERAAAKLRYARRQKTPRQPRGPAQPRVILRTDGTPVTYYGAGHVCLLLAVSTGTLNLWERDGVLPKEARITDERNRRWWPKEFIEALLPVLDEYRTGRIASVDAFRVRVREVWTSTRKDDDGQGNEVGADHDLGEPLGQG